MNREYVRWLALDNAPDRQGFFWIKGKPGSGKSTLMKFALTEIKNSAADSIVLSFFFNARGADLEKTTLGLYRSILVQLLASHINEEQLSEAVKSTSIRVRPQLEWNRQLLQDLLAHLLRLACPRKLIFIVDALDECAEDEVRDMIAFFEKISEDAAPETHPYRVLFASRHYPHITVRQSVEVILQDQEGHSHDIDKYLSSQLKIVRGKQAREIKAEIRDRACGIFMWVVLVVQILNKISDRGQGRNLQKRLRERLQEIPSDLNELFRNILTRDCEDLDEMKLCLQWILYSNRPLKREELYFAIWSGLEPEESLMYNPDRDPAEAVDRFILSSSKGLAEVTKSRDHKVQFIHESVRDFLLKGNGLTELWPDLASNPKGLGHDRLKCCCWNQLNCYAVNHAYIPAALPLANSAEAKHFREETCAKFPFLTYAATNMLAHADTALGEGISQDDMLNSNAFDTWVCSHNIVEKYQSRRIPSPCDFPCVFVEKKCYNLLRLTRQLKSPIPNNAMGRYGNPVFAAIANNDLKAFDILVEGSESGICDVDFPYWCNNVAAFLMKHGRDVLVHRFLSVYRVDIDSFDNRGENLLTWASRTGCSLTVQVLLKRIAEPDPTALTHAVAGGHEAIVKLLLDAGADPSEVTLVEAAKRGHKGSVKLLLEAWSETTPSHRPFNSALCLASLKGHDSIVKLLLDKGVQVHGNEALTSASVKGHEAIVKLLLDADANPSEKPLVEAVRRGHEGVVKLLLEAWSDANYLCECLFFALYSASLEGHEAVVKLLLDTAAGADIVSLDLNVGAALYAASCNGHETIVKLLLDAALRDDVDCLNLNIGGALYVPSRQGHEAIVKLLLDFAAGVDNSGLRVDIRDARRVASRNGHAAVVRLLSDATAARTDKNSQTLAR